MFRKKMKEWRFLDVNVANKMSGEMLQKEAIWSSRKRLTEKDKRTKLFHANFEVMSKGIATFYESNNATNNERAMLKKMQIKA